MRLWVLLVGCLWAVAGTSAAMPNVPPAATFEQLKSAALNDFLKGRDFSGSKFPPVQDFYLERSFSGPCKPLTSIKSRVEQHLKARDFSNAGASVRYPRESLGVSRTVYDGDDLKFFDVVMLVVDIRKAAGFACSYKLGAYARREMPDERVLTPKGSRELAADLDSAFSAAAASVTSAKRSEGNSGATLATWASGRATGNLSYQHGARDARAILVDQSRAIGACCGDALALYVVRGDAPPPGGGGRLRSCRALGPDAGGPAIVCTERYLKQMEVALRAFEKLPDDFATSDGMMVLFAELLRDPDKYIPEIKAGTDAGDQSDEHIGKHLALALLFVGAHEVGHLQAEQSGDYAPAGGQAPTSAKAEASKMCRHYDNLRESGIRLDVMDEILRPGGQGQVAWAKVRRELGGEDVVLAHKFAAEAYADSLSSELLIAYMRVLAARDPAVAAETRHLMVETVTALGLAYWHQQLASMVADVCPGRRFQQLGECLMWDEKSYLAANSLFEEYHRNMLQRAFHATSAVLREGSPWFSLPTSQQEIGFSDEQYRALSREDASAFAMLHSDLQRTALLGRLQDMPLKVSVGGCLSTLVQSGEFPRMARLGLGFAPVESEMQSISKEDLGFVATY